MALMAFEDRFALPEVVLWRQPSPWGNLMIAASERGICRIALPGVDNDDVICGLVGLGSPPMIRREVIHVAATQFEQYFRGDRRKFDLPIDLSLCGGVTRRILTRLAAVVPFGSIWSVDELAREIGTPDAHEVVAAALKRNPVPILVPCHRVVSNTYGKNETWSPSNMDSSIRSGLLRIEGWDADEFGIMQEETTSALEKLGRSDAVVHLHQRLAVS